MRAAVRGDRWEDALVVDNLWDERVFLSLTRRRGRCGSPGAL
jgi:hypothetical protein